MIVQTSVRIFANQIRRIILAQAYRARVGHIGSALSVADIVAAIYSNAYLLEPERDRFILSKGHAALAVYAAMFLKGWLTQAELDTYCGDDSRLGVHPEGGLKGVDFATGSLGQGLTYGCGSALAARIQGSGRRVVVLMSDAECNEGSVWEAAMFASHHGLSNLVAVVDLNGQQALGRSSDVLRMGPWMDKWESFGWATYFRNGHDPDVLQYLIAETVNRPKMILAETVFGCGVSFMREQVKWHYAPMSPAEYEQAMAEVAA